MALLFRFSNSIKIATNRPGTLLRCTREHQNLSRIVTCMIERSSTASVVAAAKSSIDQLRARSGKDEVKV